MSAWSEVMRGWASGAEAAARGPRQLKHSRSCRQCGPRSPARRPSRACSADSERDTGLLVPSRRRSRYLAWPWPLRCRSSCLPTISRF